MYGADLVWACCSEHLKDPERSFQLCQLALADPHVRTGHKVQPVPCRRQRLGWLPEQS